MLHDKHMQNGDSLDSFPQKTLFYYLFNSGLVTKTTELFSNRITVRCKKNIAKPNILVI